MPSFCISTRPLEEIYDRPHPTYENHPSIYGTPTRTLCTLGKQEDRFCANASCFIGTEAPHAVCTLGHVCGAPTAASEDLEMVKGYLTIFRKGTTSSSNLPDGCKMEKMCHTEMTRHVASRRVTPRPQRAAQTKPDSGGGGSGGRRQHERQQNKKN